MPTNLSHTSDTSLRIFSGIVDHKPSVKLLREKSRPCEFTDRAKNEGRDFYSVRVHDWDGFVEFFRNESGIVDGAFVAVGVPVNAPIPQHVRLLFDLQAVS